MSLETDTAYVPPESDDASAKRKFSDAPAEKTAHKDKIAENTAPTLRFVWIMLPPKIVAAPRWRRRSALP